MSSSDASRHELVFSPHESFPLPPSTGMTSQHRTHAPHNRSSDREIHTSQSTSNTHTRTPTHKHRIYESHRHLISAKYWTESGSSNLRMPTFGSRTSVAESGKLDANRPDPASRGQEESPGKGGWDACGVGAAGGGVPRCVNRVPSQYTFYF